MNELTIGNRMYGDVCAIFFTENPCVFQIFVVILQRIYFYYFIIIIK